LPPPRATVCRLLLYDVKKYWLRIFNSTYRSCRDSCNVRWCELFYLYYL